MVGPYNNLQEPSMLCVRSKDLYNFEIKRSKGYTFMVCIDTENRHQVGILGL